MTEHLGKGHLQRTKDKFKAFAGQIIYRTSMDYLLLGDDAIIVAFHRVNNGTAGDGLTCSVTMFEKFCRFFARHFDVIPLAQLVDNIEKGLAVNRQLAITFDDGYEDNYRYAAPLLRAMQLPATFFVVTRYIGTNFIPPWDKHLRVHQPWMNWEQVRSLHFEGFEIGSHTCTHPNLGEVRGEEAWQELLNSRLELEERLSSPITLFAYPYGGKEHLAECNREMLKAAGYRCCCACFGGTNPRNSDVFRLQRIPISSWYESPHHFGCELALQRV